jgi:signal transduction histidine kinase
MSAKLLASQLLVVVAGAGTLLLVALSIGPGIFHHHIRDALGYVPPDVARHLDMAYNDATLISLGIAVGAAVLMALALSLVVSARVVRPVRALAGAAQRIARGAHSARVPVRGTDELAQLAGAFNEMATSLERAEQIRRQLLADVAHELRNPLATVESYVEAMSDGVLQADEENWSAIRAETTRLNHLVNDLQRVSHAEAHQLDLHLLPTTISALVEDATRAAAPAYTAKGVTLDAELSSQSPAVEVDRERIAEVLANLLANALRHTPSGGEVRVLARHRGQFAEIAISDTGDGIAPEHLDRIFERFYRVDPARSRASGGTGIGLAIVRAIVEAHDGTVTATSEGIGRGATFTIQLPIRRAKKP